MVKQTKHPGSNDIYNWAWNCTIGAGLTGDDFPSKPDGEMVALLKTILGHALTHEDEREMHRAWQQCEMEQAFP